MGRKSQLKVAERIIGSVDMSGCIAESRLKETEGSGIFMPISMNSVLGGSGSGVYNYVIHEEMWVTIRRRWFVNLVIQFGDKAFR